MSAFSGRSTVATALVALALAAPASGDDAFPLRGLGRPSFLVDATTEAAAGDSVDVAVSWQVPVRELAFRAEDEVLRARYEIAVVFDRDGRQCAAELWERRVRLRTLAESHDQQRLSRGRRTVRLPQGEYELRVSVTDRTSGASSTASANLDARARKSGIGLSDLRLVRYTKGGAEANPSHDVPLGETGHVVRAVVRSATGGEETVELRWKISDPGGGVTLQGDSTVTVGTEPRTVDFALGTDRLAPGAHDVEVRVVGKGGGERRHLQLQARLTPSWFTIHRGEALEILSLVAGDDDIGALRAAEGTSWPDALASFWKAHDPSPGTEDNEFIRDVEDRVETATTLFVEPFRSPGWRTDRGRVWVRYGRPDRRSTSTGDFDRPGREVWEYDSPRRVFVFVDRGSGEYWLSG
ncbi:MAG: GWxTD domain-containing protein [bacterium]